jgi:hypothetical protein
MSNQHADVPERRSSAWRRAGAMLVSHRWLILAEIALALMLLLLVHHLHVDLLESAFGTPQTSPGGNCPTIKGSTTDCTSLFSAVSNLTTDADYVLVPCVTLAGAVGAIFWALGHRRGPGIVGGALAAGAIGVGMATIAH